MSMRLDGGRVLIDISEEEFTILLLMLGWAVGNRSVQEAVPGWWLLVNSINEGNPHFTPYTVEAVEAVEARR